MDDYLDPDDIDGLRAPSTPGSTAPAPRILAVDQYLNEDLDQIPVPDLIDLYEAIRNALPAHKLQDIDLAQELVLQFMKVKDLQATTHSDLRAKASEKAAVANSVATILAHLTRLQTELHTAERFKLLENNMIRQFKKLPADVVEAFLDEYESL